MQSISEIFKFLKTKQNKEMCSSNLLVNFKAQALGMADTETKVSGPFLVLAPVILQDSCHEICILCAGGAGSGSDSSSDVFNQLPLYTKQTF